MRNKSLLGKNVGLLVIFVLLLLPIGAAYANDDLAAIRTATVKYH